MCFSSRLALRPRASPYHLDAELLIERGARLENYAAGSYGPPFDGMDDEAGKILNEIADLIDLLRYNLETVAGEAESLARALEEANGPEDYSRRMVFELRAAELQAIIDGIKTDIAALEAEQSKLANVTGMQV